MNVLQRHPRHSPESIGRPIGKVIRGAIYIHRSAWPAARKQVSPRLAAEIDKLLRATEPSFNVLKVEAGAKRVTFLSYAHFFEDPFPALEQSRQHQFASGTILERRYGRSGNPPILHRKELLLRSDDARRGQFETLTRNLESRDLFREAHKIGCRKAWAQRLEAAGLTLQGHTLIEI